jgi:hypothetical protein
MSKKTAVAGRPAPKATTKKAAKKAPVKSVKVVKPATSKKGRKTAKLRGIAAMQVVEEPAPVNAKKAAKTALDAVDKTGELYEHYYVPLAAKQQANMEASADFYYSLGAAVRDLRPAKGHKAVSTLAEVLRVPSDNLRKAEQLVNQYTRKQMDTLIRRGLVWGHLRLLASVPTGEARLAFEQQAITQHWDAARLSDEIRSALAGGETRHGAVGAGRPYAVPDNVDDGVYHALKQMQQFVKAHQATWTSVLGFLQGLTDDQLTHKMYQRLVTLYNETMAVQQASTQICADLYPVVTRARNLQPAAAVAAQEPEASQPAADPAPSAEMPSDVNDEPEPALPENNAAPVYEDVEDDDAEAVGVSPATNFTPSPVASPRGGRR